MTNKYECTEERFLTDVKDHKISIEKDDGVHRFIRFRRENGSAYWFDLITWPGNLCISGDCGTYVLSRLPDMFDFFRIDEGDFNKRKDRLLNINPGYWGEKLQSIGTNAGYEEFSEEKFEVNVKDYFDSYMAPQIETEIEKDELWQEITEEILNYSCDGSDRVHQRLYDFEHEGYSFDLDQFSNSERFTFHFIWCLYAIVWGIIKYDEAKQND